MSGSVLALLVRAHKQYKKRPSCRDDVRNLSLLDEIKCIVTVIIRMLYLGGGNVYSDGFSGGLWPRFRIKRSWCARQAHVIQLPVDFSIYRRSNIVLSKVDYGFWMEISIRVEYNDIIEDRSFEFFGGCENIRNECNLEL